MAPTIQNMIVVYREGDNDSLTFASYYASVRGLDDAQLIALPCSGDEILANYASFQSQIENPLKNAIANEYAVTDLQVILVGYGVPGGFHDGSDIVSTTSRLSRIHHPYSKGFLNPLFNRQQFQRYNDADTSTALIVSRIDAPTLDIALSIVDSINLTIRQGFANGKIYFDPYAPTVDDEEASYQQELFDFENLTLPILNLVEYRTTFWDQATDVVIPKLTNDSFMWSWKADRAGYTFFQNQTRSRIFQYNADLDGGASVRDADDKRWPMLALTSGYIASAGAMSDPLPEGFLRPSPFFDALFRGATIGEAFMFACPNLDWTVTLFGDPLVTTRFPIGLPLTQGFSTSSGWMEMEQNLQSVISYYLCRQDAANDIYNSIVLSKDVQTITSLLTSVTALVNEVVAETIQDLNRLVVTYLSFPPIVNSLSEYISQNNLQVSELLTSIVPSLSLASNLFYDSGSWQFEDIIQNPAAEFLIYNFVIDVASDPIFSQIIFTINSATDQTGWSFEKTNDVFSPIPDIGVTSSYAGRRVRYVASTDQYLQSKQIIFIRIKQVDEFGDPTSYRYFQKVIGT